MKKSERRAKEDELIRRESIKVRIVTPKSSRKKEKLRHKNASKATRDHIPKDNSNALPLSKTTAKSKPAGEPTNVGSNNISGDNLAEKRKYSIFKSRNSMGGGTPGVRFTDPTVGKKLCIRDGSSVATSGL